MDYCIWIVVINLHLVLLSCRGLQGQGLFLSLRGTLIDNDGFVNASDIGVGYDALLCLTNVTNCCSGSNRMGEWHFPNGTVVGSFSDNGGSPNNDFFSRNRDQSVVRLNRYSNPSERGRFRCELLGDTIYVNILDISLVSIAGAITVTFGGTVNLQCLVDITPHPLPAGTSTPEFEWFLGQTFDSPLTSTATNSSSIYTSTLQLTSVSESDEGMYTCRLRGNHMTAVSTLVTIEPGPTVSLSTTTSPTPMHMVSLSITPSGTNTAGARYSLVCSVTVTGSTDTPTITWFDPMDSTVPSEMVSTTGSMSTLTFNPLSASHAGTYTCRATVGSGMQTNANHEVVDVTVEVPTPTLSITSNPTGAIPSGSSVTLTCTVVLDSSVDVPVAVNTVWTGPAGVTLSPTDPVEVTSTRYTSTVMINSFGRDKSGNYTCKATVSSTSQSPFIINSLASSATIRVTAASVSTVQIDDGGLTPVTGQSYTLTCNVSGTTFNIYQWRKDGAVISGETGPTLSFSPLRLPDAGQYSCGNGTLFSNNRSITLQVPGPATVSITSSIAGPVIILGTAVTLSCTVELSPALRESDLTLLTVDVQLFRDGIPLTLTSTLTVTGTTFIYSTRFNSFNRTDSGNYTCVATVRPHPMASTYIRISESRSSLQSPVLVIIAGISPPLNVRASQASPFDTVEVSWSPPSGGATAITRYTIFYGNGANVSLPSVATLIGLTLNGDHVGEIVSVCAEAAQLASQCVNTSVGAKDGEMTTDNIISDSTNCSHTTEIGTTALVIFAVMATVILCLVVALMVVIVWLLWIKRKKIATKGDFAVSANVAYGEVKLEDSGAVYEDLDKVVKRVEGNYELTEHPAAYEFPVIQTAAPVCDTIGESTKPSSEQQQQQAANKDSPAL